MGQFCSLNLSRAPRVQQAYAPTISGTSARSGALTKGICVDVRVHCSNRCMEMDMAKASIIGVGLLITLGFTPAQAGPCTSEINKLMASHDAGSGPTAGATPSTSTAQVESSTAQHPPTALMGKETEGRAASPADVQRQTAGQPTAAQQPPQPDTTSQKSSALAALDRARSFDQQGREAECMDAVNQARQLSIVR
jgi:hypothetical protein